VKAGAGGIDMVTLTARGRLFVQEALKEANRPSLLDEAASLGPDPWSRPLSPRAARVAIDALSEMEKNIRDRLGIPKLDEDEKSDLINDLSFVAAVRYDIERDTGHL
jgi:hypothetical protein